MVASSFITFCSSLGPSLPRGSSGTGSLTLGSKLVVPAVNVLGRQVERSHPLEAGLHQFVAIDESFGYIQENLQNG